MLNPPIEPAPLIFLSFLVGILAGIAGCGIGLMAFRHLLPRLFADLPIRFNVNTADVTIPVSVMAPQSVRIPVTIAAPEAVSIPVELAPTANAAASSTNPELAARILAEVPDLGPRALSRILQVSSSTAQGYITRAAPAPAPIVVAKPDPEPIQPNFRDSVWWTTTPTPTGDTDDSKL